MLCLIRGGALNEGRGGICHPFDGIFNIHVIHIFHTSGTLGLRPFIKYVFRQYTKNTAVLDVGPYFGQ